MEYNLLTGQNEASVFLDSEYAREHDKFSQINKDFWSHFEKSGAIADYLKYTACAKELE